MGQIAYTKNQVFWGTFFGGPIAAVYFLKKNFDAMGNGALSQKTVKLGAQIIFLFALAVPFLPDAIPSVAYSIAYSFVARMIYEQHQTSLQNAPRYSHWNVVGYALLWMVAIMAVIIPVAMIYDFLGWIDLSAAPPVE